MALSSLHYTCSFSENFMETKVEIKIFINILSQEADNKISIEEIILDSLIMKGY